MAAPLQSAGWAAPEEGTERTRHAALAWPGRSADYQRLTQAAVVVLRDVHEVPSPAVLQYRAWREAEPAPDGVLYHKEDLEPDEPHPEFPSLGLRDASVD